MRRPLSVVTLAHVALFVIALALRCNWNEAGNGGLVFERHDEVHYVPVAIDLLRGAWDINYFINPALYSLLLAGLGAFWGVIGLALGRFESWGEYGLAMALDPAEITLLGRGLSCAASVASVLVLFHIGRLAFSARVGFVGACALAVDLLHAERGVIAGNESLMVLLVLLAFGAGLAHLERPSSGRHALSWGLFGLACAAKYSAGLMVFPILAMSWGARSRGGWRPLSRASLLGLAAAPCAFLLGSPWTLLHPVNFYRDFRTQADFLHQGYFGAEAESGALGFGFYLTEFPSRNVGLAFSLLCGAGILLALWRALREADTRARALFLAILPAYLYLGSGVFFRMRFFLVAVPFVLLSGGLVVDALASRLPGQRSARLVACAAIALLVVPALENRSSLQRIYPEQNERVLLLEWLEENLDREHKLVELTLGMPQLGRRRRLEQHGIDVESMTDPASRERLRVFLEETRDVTRFQNHLARASNLAELQAELARADYDRLIMVFQAKHYPVLREMPLYAADTSIQDCTWWGELVLWLQSLPRTKEVVSAQGNSPMVMTVIELP